MDRQVTHTNDETDQYPDAVREPDEPDTASELATDEEDGSSEEAGYGYGV